MASAKMRGVRHFPRSAVGPLTVAAAAVGSAALASGPSGGLLPKPPRLGRSAPPSKPLPSKGFGDYCFRATVRVSTKGPESRENMRCFGFDTSPEVAQNTLRACRLHARGLPGGLDARTFDDPELVLLPRGMESSGQIFAERHGVVRRLA